MPAADPNHASVSVEELRHILGIFSNGTVTTAPRDGHHRYPSHVTPHSTRVDRDIEVPEASTSASPARLDVKEVD